MESTFVAAPMFTESAGCGGAKRFGGPHQAVFVIGAGPGAT